MADVELVIKIPEGLKKDFELEQWTALSCMEMKNALINGKPLPKGHGRLKDFEKIYADMSEREELARQRVVDTPSSSPCYMRYVAQLNERTAFKEMLFDAPTIIEADKETGND